MGNTTGDRIENLQAMLLTSPHTSASIVRKSSDLAEEAEGILAVYFAEDLEGENPSSLLAGEKVDYYGQAVGLIVGTDRTSCLEALGKIEIEYHTVPGVLNVAHAKAVRNSLEEELSLDKGNPDNVPDKCEVLVEGSVSISSQHPVSSGNMMVIAEPLDGKRSIRVKIPTESPSAVRARVAEVTGIPESRVQVEGETVLGFSGARGEESSRLAGLAAAAAMQQDHAVCLQLDSSQDWALSGKRHAVEAEFRVGCDKSGLILAADIDLVMDGGAEDGQGQAALKQAMLNVDGAYGIPDIRVNGRLCRTNGLTGESVSAEGSAQGVLIIEDMIARVARKLGKSADTVRELNFYRSKKGAALTPYGQIIDTDIFSRLWIAILSASDFHKRREEIEKWNQRNHACKRGIAVVPVKMGIGDPKLVNNQARVCLQAFLDGSVRVQISSVDIGDGLLIRVKRQASSLLGVEESKIEVIGAENGNLSPSMQAYVIDTPALIRGAVKDVCERLNEQLGGQSKTKKGKEDSFSSRVLEAEKKGENLTVLGFYRQSGTSWDNDRLKGSPFAEYFHGGSVVEVELDAFTGEVQVLRADLYCEGDETENAELDRAQISRAYMMGQGWMLNEDVNTRIYTIPGYEEAPVDFRIEILDIENRGKRDRSCVSCAEAPVAMAAATREAVKEAIYASAPKSQIDIDLSIPAGPSVVMKALREISLEAANIE